MVDEAVHESIDWAAFFLVKTKIAPLLAAEHEPLAAIGSPPSL